MPKSQVLFSFYWFAFYFSFSKLWYVGNLIIFFSGWISHTSSSPFQDQLWTFFKYVIVEYFPKKQGISLDFLNPLFKYFHIIIFVSFSHSFYIYYVQLCCNPWCCLFCRLMTFITSLYQIQKEWKETEELLLNHLASTCIS
jgi:hypothetical protein